MVRCCGGAAGAGPPDRRGPQHGAAPGAPGINPAGSAFALMINPIANKVFASLSNCAPVAEPCTSSARPRAVTPEHVGKFRPPVGERATEQPGPAATLRTEIDAVLGQQRDHLVEPIHVRIEIKGEWVTIVVAHLRQRRDFALAATSHVRLHPHAPRRKSKGIEKR